jgi:hypothetical protein
MSSEVIIFVAVVLYILGIIYQTLALAAVVYFALIK